MTEKELIKEIVTENFSCSYCKELGLFDGCNAKKKSCKQTVSEWFDKVMEQEKMTDEELEKETMKRLSVIRQKKYRCRDI